MEGTPSFKIYSPKGEYVAACKYPEDAAAVVANWGDGSTIRWRHGRILYTNGKDGSAANSFDEVGEICRKRILYGKEA